MTQDHEWVWSAISLLKSPSPQAPKDLIQIWSVHYWETTIYKWNFNWSLWGASLIGQAKLGDCNQIQGHVVIAVFRVMLILPTTSKLKIKQCGSPSVTCTPFQCRLLESYTLEFRPHHTFCWCIYSDTSPKAFSSIKVTQSGVVNRSERKDKTVIAWLQKIANSMTALKKWLHKGLNAIIKEKIH